MDMTKEQRARGLFAAGYNCAQSVLGAFCAQEGFDLNTALKIANGFGGGLRCGEVCGAVSGAIMALGLRHGFCAQGDMEGKTRCYQKTYEFIEKFKGERGTILCRELVGHHIRHPDDFPPLSAQGVFKVCPDIIGTAVRVLETVLNEPQETQ